jgi:hypothetical protein
LSAWSQSLELTVHNKGLSDMSFKSTDNFWHCKQSGHEMMIL